ncbi:MAG: GLPGLI family protein [Muribaculaceae bacterium]|nr:GLPGLI family protein [Muribaculaceae bacterium]
MKHIIATAMLMAAGVAYASSPALYECIYRYDMKGISGDKEIFESSDCILLIGEDKSKFYDYSAFRIDSVSAIPGVAEDVVKKFNEEHMNRDTYFEQEVNTSLGDDKITVYCDMAPERYKYEQSLPLTTWEETDETADICGYPCRKATGEYGGRKWQAWYTEDIPVPFGPWKISGLPGLVLKAADESGNHSFEAIAFRQGNGEFAPSKIPNQISIGHEKFIELKNDYDKDPTAAINPEGISEITVAAGGNIIINGVKSRLNKNKAIPLEYTQAELNGTKKEKSSKAKKNSLKDAFEDVEVIEVRGIPK